MDRGKSIFTVKNLYLAIASIFFVQIVYYFFTGAGGALKLAIRLIPITTILFFLGTIQKGRLYKGLGDTWNRIIIAVYIAIGFGVLLYLEFEHEKLFLYRAGAYTKTDILVGVLIFLLVLEIARNTQPILFWVNIGLIFYCLYGYLSPIDFFWHPGTNITRIITSSTIEFSTGVFGRFAQLALTMVSSFLLLGAVAKAFGAERAIVRFVYSLLGKNEYNLPQVAVISSTAIGCVSGSGAASVAITGGFSIPLMIDHGFPPVYAAAVQTSAAMGSLIMPPIMGVAGFLMADFLGVTYWDVVVRAFGVGILYYLTVMMAVYLISIRTIKTGKEFVAPAVPVYDKVKTYVFIISVLALILLMGVFKYGPMRAAVIVATMYAALLMLVHIYYKYYKKESAFKEVKEINIIKTIIESYADLTVNLVLLMATIGLMIGLFTITGFITRMGDQLVSLGSTSLILTIIVTWAFGWIAGMGLPPSAAYIIIAVAAVPAFTTLGINPWVTHFLVFIISVMGEFSPPTSMASAVASRIAGTPFLKTVMQGLKICTPIFIISFAIFTRPNLVIQPGLGQIIELIIIAAGCFGTCFILYGVFSKKAMLNVLFKGCIAVFSSLALFHPNTLAASLGAALTFGILIKGISSHRKLVQQSG